MGIIITKEVIMVRDKFELKLFFEELLNLAIEDVRRHEGRNMGFACDKLLSDIIIRHDPFLDRILNDYSEDSHEYRLNNAGLKMYWTMKKDNNGERFFLCTIGGDQAKDYDWFVNAARMLLRSRGCCKHRYRETHNLTKVIKWKNIN
jgi:hypothetical protein